ncbi:MAG: FdtA/QdtA family cupin domain-containing protein [Pseudomonadota bacterium]|nr:FdtA/QdtA family cupin domain-containing protein [Pseudomonadota bacterium]
MFDTERVEKLPKEDNRLGTWELLKFVSKGDDRGELVAIQNSSEIPFDIKRVYYLVNTKAGVIRGLHAHSNLDQVLIAISGSCRVSVDNSQKKEEFLLDDCRVGLRIRNYVWREMFEFSQNCVLLVLANRFYDPNDYIRDYGIFLNKARGL